MWMTFYGVIDVPYIEFPFRHPLAGGTGTYADPITFASDKTEFPLGTIIYVPFLQKYFIMEDGCVQCEADWLTGMRHVDLWGGGKAVQAPSFIPCVDYMTQETNVAVNPSKNLPVSSKPIFNETTQECFRAWPYYP